MVNLRKLKECQITCTISEIASYISKFPSLNWTRISLSFTSRFVAFRGIGTFMATWQRISESSFDSNFRKDKIPFWARITVQLAPPTVTRLIAARTPNPLSLKYKFYELYSDSLGVKFKSNLDMKEKLPLFVRSRLPDKG